MNPPTLFNVSLRRTGFRGGTTIFLFCNFGGVLATIFFTQQKEKEENGIVGLLFSTLLQSSFVSEVEAKMERFVGGRC